MKTITFDETQWKLVPIEPTERMVVAGFESESDKCFTPTVDWDQYEAMTGCQQAAHRAKLCWSAMLEAAPTPPADGQPNIPEIPDCSKLIRDAALEEAAQLCERDGALYTGVDMTGPIRALKSQPVPGAQDREDALALFDIAVAQELPRVSTIKYNSHEICDYFAQHVRNAMAAHVAPANAQEQENAESILLGQILSDWHNRGETGDVDGAWLQDIVVDSGLATLNDEGYVLTQRAMELIGMGDAARALKGPNHG